MSLVIDISRDQYCTPNCGAKYVVITVPPFSFYLYWEVHKRPLRKKKNQNSLWHALGCWISFETFVYVCY